MQRRLTLTNTTVAAIKNTSSQVNTHILKEVRQHEERIISTICIVVTYHIKYLFFALGGNKQNLKSILLTLSVVGSSVMQQKTCKGFMISYHSVIFMFYFLFIILFFMTTNNFLYSFLFSLLKTA